MASAARRWWRRCRRVGGYGAILLLIAMAVLVALANQFLPVLEQHPRQVERWLSEHVGQPVRFSAIDARWTRAGPRLELDGLVVGSDDRQLAIGRAELLVSVYAGLLPGRPLTELSIDGLSLTLRQDTDGRWRMSGLPAPRQADADPLDVLAGFGELRVQEARLHVLAERWGIDHVLPRLDGRLRVSGSRVRGGARVWSADGRAPLDLVVDVARDGVDGRLWAGTEAGELSAWGPLLAGLGVEPLGGGGAFGAWAELVERRIDRVQVDATLVDLRLRRRGTALPPLAFDRARFAAQWQMQGEGWQVSVPRGEFEQGGRQQRIEGFWMAGGERLALDAARIDAGPLLALAALSNRLPSGLAAWMAEARPRGTVTRLSVPAGAPGELAGSAVLSDVAFEPVGRRPGLSGLGGALRFDAQGGLLALDGREWGLDWREEFGPTLALSPRGDLVLWRDEAGWGLGTPDLAIAAPGLALRARFALGLQADGTRPTLDLAAELDAFDVVAAKRFWPRGAMPAPVRAWLDRALVSGTARGGRVALGGDLDHWPFRDGEGRFDARVRLEDVVLAFNEGWPEATGLHGDAHFTGPGMALEGLSATVLDTPVPEASGRIADFREAWLELDLRGVGDAADMRRLALQSPLYAPNRSHLDAVSLRGAATLDLRLRLPLKREFGERRVAGTLTLEKASVADRRWDVAFDGLSGTVPFTDRGFIVDGLPVREGETPAVLTLRVGDTVVNPGNVAEFALQAELAPDQLLGRAPELDWLSPWLSGRSAWDVRVAVPKTLPDVPPAPARLRLESSLVGTRLGLPAPLRKSAATPLTLRLELPMPVSAGAIELGLGRLLRLRGRLPDGEAPFAAVADFGGEPSGLAIPASGIAVRGQMTSLDVAGWVAAAAEGSGPREGGVQSVDVQVGAIDVLDRSFGEGRVRLGRTADELRVDFEGAAIAGDVRVPYADGAAIKGRFARLHWPAVDTKAMTGGGDAAPAVDETDPSRLPPLRFEIEDFRLGEARLGRSELRTFPTPEGMHIDRFSTVSDALAVGASGDWTRIGGATRSRFAVDFDAGSLGGMLDALGFAGMVEEGAVKARLVGDWPGSPGSFRLDRFDGDLRVDVGKGRLLDVEPGTGRLLGLISIAEIPRRLTLDFSDFFSKGFAFNAMSGDFAFEGGAATTDNLRIDGPAAEINVSGTTALSERTYRQRVEVLPKAGGVLPAIGAVTGGPAGAAIGAMAQAVFQSPLKQATRTVYAVEGSWAEPQVDVVERGPRRTAGGEDEAAPAPSPSPEARTGSLAPRGGPGGGLETGPADPTFAR